MEADKLVNIIECSKGSGYGQSSKEELEFIANFFQSTKVYIPIKYCLYNARPSSKNHIVETYEPIIPH